MPINDTAQPVDRKTARRRKQAAERARRYRARKRDEKPFPLETAQDGKAGTLAASPAQQPVLGHPEPQKLPLEPPKPAICWVEGCNQVGPFSFNLVNLCPAHYRDAALHNVAIEHLKPLAVNFGRPAVPEPTVPRPPRPEPGTIGTAYGQRNPNCSRCMMSPSCPDHHWQAPPPSPEEMNRIRQMMTDRPPFAAEADARYAEFTAADGFVIQKSPAEQERDREQQELLDGQRALRPMTEYDRIARIAEIQNQWDRPQRQTQEEAN